VGAISFNVNQNAAAIQASREIVEELRSAVREKKNDPAVLAAVMFGTRDNLRSVLASTACVTSEISLTRTVARDACFGRSPFLSSLKGSSSF